MGAGDTHARLKLDPRLDSSFIRLAAVAGRCSLESHYSKSRVTLHTSMLEKHVTIRTIRDMGTAKRMLDASHDAGCIMLRML